MTETKAKSPLFVYLLLDRSGSMEDQRDRTIGAVNEYVNGLKLSEATDARVSLTIFDSQSIDALYRAVPAAHATPLNRESYVPRGMTPLFDAIGRAVSDADGETLREGEKVALVIVTDGLENASTEYKKDTIRKLLEGRQKDRGWLVSFLGADIDAFAAGDAIGVSQDHSLKMKKHRLAESLSATRERQEIYAATGAAPAYSAAQRRQAMED